jgi:hypothetical protein
MITISSYLNVYLSIALQMLCEGRGCVCCVSTPTMAPNATVSEKTEKAEPPLLQADHQED